MYESKPHGNKGRKHTQETRAKIAEAMRNNANAGVPDDLRIHPQRKEKGAHALKGKPKSAEHRQKIARAMQHNSNASVLNRVLKTQTPHQIKPLKTVSQRFDESPKAYKQRKGHSEETRAKIRAAMTGNHNAIRERTYTNQLTHNKPVQELEDMDDLKTLEQELIAMIKPDKKPPTPPNTLDNMRDFFETDAEFQEWKATQND